MKQAPWVRNVLRPLLLAAMTGCVGLAIAELIHLAVPAWHGSYVVIGCVLAAFEAAYSHRLLQARELRGKERRRFRIVEILLLFLLLKAATYVGDSWEAVLADLRTWPSQPGNIFDVETLVTLTLVIGSWWAATETIHDLEQLEEAPRIRESATGTPPGPGNTPFVQSTSWSGTPPRERLINRFMAGGALILVVAGFSRVGIAALTDTSRPRVPGLVLHVLFYFLLGFVLLGHAQFTSLHTVWATRGVRTDRRMPGRWVRYSLAFVGLALVVAFVLPTGYTINLLALLEYILLLFSFMFTLLFAVLVAPLGRLLFGGEGPDTELPSLPEAPEALSEPGSTAPAWLAVLRSLVFWAALIGVVIYIIRAYLRDHPEIWRAISSLGPFRALARLLAALWRRLGGLASAVRERIPRTLSLRRARAHTREDRAPSFRLGALSPRGRVRYYYLSTLRRAGRKGIPRHPSQTPYEYDGTLEPHLPAAQQEMGDLTGAFVEAHYSRHPLGRKEEREIRTRWKRVKAALRALGQEKSDTG